MLWLSNNGANFVFVIFRVGGMTKSPSGKGVSPKLCRRP